VAESGQEVEEMYYEPLEKKAPEPDTAYSYDAGDLRYTFISTDTP